MTKRSNKMMPLQMKKSSFALLSLFLVLTFLIAFPIKTLHAESASNKDVKPRLTSSLNNRMQNVTLGSTSRSKVYKDLPFEPLIDNNQSNSSLALKEHKGESWIEFTIEHDDTIYSLVRRNGLSIKDLFVIMHVGLETSELKHLVPGQKLQIHASDKNILEIVHFQNKTRKLHVKKESQGYSGLTTVKGIKVDVIEPKKSRALLARSNKSYPPLREQSDNDLQQRLENTISQLGLIKEVNRKKLAIALVDITDIRQPKLAMLNGNEMMYAASLPKIAILLGAFVEIEQGHLSFDRTIKNDLTEMIRFSSNEKATKMLGRVGNHRLQEILMSDRFKLYDPLQNGGLWVGKAYGKTPAFERDPLHNLSHGATVLQAARFYYLMETDQLVSHDLTVSMKEILSDPKINHKFVKGLAERPEATIYRKSGSWRQWHADSALIEANGYKYIAVALAEDPKGGQWLSQMIAPLHDLIVPRTYAELSQDQ